MNAGRFGAEALQNALDCAAIVAVTDRRGVIQSCNDKFCEISGNSRAELIGSTHRLVNSGHHPPEFFAGMYAALSGGAVWRGTIRNRTKAGGVYWVDTTIVPMRAEDDRVDGYIAIRFDVTHHVLALEALAASLAAGASAHNYRERLLATLNDQLKTPLNGILGMTEALGRRVLSAEDRATVTLIGGAGRELSDLLDNALAAPGGAPTTANRPIALQKKVRRVVDEVQLRALQKGGRIDLAISGEEEPCLLGDAPRLKQAIEHLLLHAIEVCERPLLSIRTTVERTGRFVEAVIDVEGADPSLANNWARQILDPYDGALQDWDAEGAGGLHLATAKSLVELIGGELFLLECSGRITLRLRTPLAEEHSAGAAGPAPEVDKLRILIADDSLLNRRVTAQLLSPLDAEISFAEDGLQAVQAFEKAPFDLVLMDVKMPTLDGLSAIELIRAIELRTGRSPTPIATVSANTSPKDHEAAVRAGADLCIDKPVSAATLYQGINQLLAMGGQLAA